MDTGTQGAQAYLCLVDTLKQRLTDTLEAAGFTSREGHLPVLGGGGTFEIIAGIGAEIRVAWWERERRKLLEEFAAALKAAGFTVEDRIEALYVAAE